MKSLGTIARVIAMCSVVLLMTQEAALAQNHGPWWTWSTVDGDWDGYRDIFADHGLVFSGITVADFQGNVSGGTSRAFAPVDASVVAVDIDLDRLAKLNGLLFHVEFTSVAGENLSTKSIGNILQVATAFAEPGYYLGQMYLQQKLLDDKLTLQAGRMTTATNFASLPIFNDYVAYTVNPIPISLTNNVLYFTSLPSVTWAAVGTIAPIQSVSFAAGIYNTNTTSALPVASRNGIDFSFEDDGGPMEVAQLTYNLNRGSDELGLPGIYNIGTFYSDADYQALSNGSTKRGNYGFYLEAQQMIYRYGGPGSDVGLTPWLTITSNPQQKINPLPLLVMIGAAYHGLIPRRSDDSTAMAFYYGKLNISSAEPVPSSVASSIPNSTTNNEKVLEFAYTCWATPWLGITPDFQYVLNPNGTASSRNAAVPGIQLQMLF